MPDWFDGGGNGHVADVAALMDSDAPSLLWRCVAAGALVSVGLTSDGGAMSVTITVDGRWRREYFRDAEELTAWMAEAVPAVETATSDRPASTVPRQRSRGRRGL